MGIGWDGRTLREMAEERQRLYEQSGHYCGLRELPLARKDPLKLEVLATRLLAAVISGRETARMISASPIVREMAELAVAIYTAEGDCVLQSTGLLIHLTLMGEVIQWMIRENYEEEPGIHEGDGFTSNDSYIAGMHSADLYDIMPIFWEGSLVGWVSTVVMEPEVGALAPGCLPSGATERFVEGLRFTAEKTVVNDRYVKAFERRVRLGCRMADLFLLDRKGALAANIKARAAIRGIIEEFGPETYLEGTRELIELERRAQLERVKRRTVPGKFHGESTYEIYASRGMVPPHHAIDRITLVPLDFHIRADGTYFLDFDGTGSWGWHPSNITPAALRSALCMILTTTLSYGGTANEGTFLTVGMNTPSDTFVNPTSPNIATGMLIAWPVTGGGLWMGQQSRAFFSRGFVEEFRAPVVLSYSTSAAVGMGGTDHWGRDFGFLNVEMMGCFGSGAFAIRDGILADSLAQADADMGNAEVWELVLPVLWMGRKLLPDACGWGKYRSGYSVVSTYMIHGTDLLSLDTIGGGHCERICPNTGMFGGYPSQSGFGKVLTKTNLLERAQEQQPLAHGAGYPGRGDLEENVKGELIIPKVNSYVKAILGHGDLNQAYFGGAGGGVGDPIRRDPTLAKWDLDNGLLTVEQCRRIYCIEATYDPKAEEWIIDEKKTAELRKQRRQDRLAKGVPAKLWWEQRRRDLLERNMPHLLKEMYNDSLAKGARWPGEFRSFWQLPEGFTF